jgi:eukaryotic-like serine/threonine-protein kinase
MTAEGQVLDLATSVADGDDIDWAGAVARAANAEQRALIQRLRVIASIREVHRTAESLGSGDDEPPAERARVVGRIGPVEGVAPAADVALRSGVPGSRSGPPPASHWGALTLKERVGAGVFGEVYRAYDNTLERDVALKLLKIRSSAAPLASKMLHEGRLLARVHHPNVVTVHGVEVHDNRVGLWMEFIRGRTLETLLESQGPFGAREATLVGQDLCRALAAVHAAGFLHRDVKAQNVMREEGGRVVLMDFGTGLLMRKAGGLPGAPTAGTPLYLAPELMNGGDATPASDLYSVGVLLFHLVTGGYPVSARSLPELKEAHARGDQERLHDLRPDLPDAFIQVVERALDRDPSQRYQSAGALQQALTHALGVGLPDAMGERVVRHADAERRPAVAGVSWVRGWRTWALVLAALGIAAALTLWITKAGPARVGSPISSVVILPLANLSAGDGDLAKGITLLIQDRLSTLSRVRVVSYTPGMASRDRGVAVGDVISRHEVEAAVDGSVSWTGDKAQVAVRLIRAGSTSPIWTRQFERPIRRAAELPRDVAREVSRALAVQLTQGEEERLAAADSAEPNVFENYLRGRVQLRAGTIPSVDAAAGHFLRALERDPNHAPSLAALARCYILQGVSFRTRPLAEASALARNAAQRALAIDDSLADAHEVEAQVRFYADWDMDAAEASYQRAVELNPNSGDTRYGYAMFLASRRRLPDAMQQMQTAVALDPVSTNANAGLAMLWHYARVDDQAARLFREVLQQNPRSLAARLGLARTLLGMNQYDEALVQVEEIRRLTNDALTPAHLGALGIAYVGLGRLDEARAIAERLTRDDSSDGASYDAASVWASLGDRKRAIETLERAVAERHPKALFLRLDRRFDSLRDQPAFVALLNRFKPNP